MSRKVGLFPSTLRLRRMLDREFIKREVSLRLTAELEKRGIAEEHAAREIDISYRQFQRWTSAGGVPSRASRGKLKKWGVKLDDLFPAGKANGQVIGLLEEMNGKLDTLLKKDP